MSQKILTFVEQRGGEIKKSSRETLSLARQLAADLGAASAAVVVGKGIEGLGQALAQEGVAAVYVVDAEALELYSTEGYAQAVARAVEAAGADVLLFAASAMGKDLAPRMAARLDFAFLAEVTEAKAENGRILATRPQYAGKTLWQMSAPAEKVVVTTRPNVFSIQPAEGAAGEIVSLELGDVDIRARTVSFHGSEKGMIDVAEADVIVSGGRGLKGPENFPLVFALADALGAGVGASRAVVDAGWIDHDHQVGQTGKTVSPNLYIAAGISGAIQHLAGMRTSKCIVAINKDPDAPIFKEADFGVVGDALELLPQLTEEVKRIKGAS
jgi:electron transfer flavoprotein alpha subunit